MVERKEVALNDPVTKYLPKGIKVPERNGHYITLADLATHTSGLPYIPDNMGFDPAKAEKYSKKDIYDLSSRYTEGKLYQFLSGYTLSRDIGSGWEYSNVDYGLLGKALADRTGMDYETLVRKRITEPLQMKSTAITVSRDMKERLGSGHDVNLQPTPDVSMPTMEAAGSLRSTASDLLTLLEVFTQHRQVRLNCAAKAMLETRRPGPGFQQALGWWILALGPGQDSIVLFGGETLGYSCTIAYDPKMFTGVIVLTNSDQKDGGLCLHILRPSFPVETSSITK
jgi:serine-type D-Ala-D-Ala carboxypeptidase/endopeptidase